ncbi:MAG: hypothetical protein Tsb0015_03480 [Simkaniaceae bacterium]
MSSSQNKLLFREWAVLILFIFVLFIILITSKINHKKINEKINSFEAGNNSKKIIDKINPVFH